MIVSPPPRSRPGRNSLSPFHLGRILAAACFLVLLELPSADQHEGDAERDELIAVLEPACATSDAKRAATALSRMHGRGEGDAGVHCWLAGVFAGAADPDGAYRECHKAFSLSPSQPCSLYCLAHFLLWHAEWQSLEAVAPMAKAAVDSELEKGVVPSIAYLEALLLLPTSTLHRLLSSRAEHLLLHPPFVLGHGQEQQPLVDRWWIPPAPLSPAPSTSPHPLVDEGGTTTIRVVFICAAARDHPHGRVLLDALESLGRGRSRVRGGEMAASSGGGPGGGGGDERAPGGGRGGERRGGGGGGGGEAGAMPAIEAACIFTGAAPDVGDETRERIQSACAYSIQLREGASPSLIAATVNERRAHVAVDVDGWAEGAHVAAMRLRPALVSVLFVGHVGSAGVEGAHDYVFTVVHTLHLIRLFVRAHRLFFF